MIIDTAAIYDKGYEAGKAGKRCGKTPYTQKDLQRVWIAGWRAGSEEMRKNKQSK